MRAHFKGGPLDGQDYALTHFPHTITVSINNEASPGSPALDAGDHRIALYECVAAPSRKPGGHGEPNRKAVHPHFLYLHINAAFA